jgi:hypothetical protein
MSRHQYRHGRTLDAIELRGAVAMRADKTREGDTICFLDPRDDYRIESIETCPLGKIRHRSRNDTMTSHYDADEFVYVMRDSEWGQQCT